MATRATISVCDRENQYKMNFGYTYQDSRSNYGMKGQVNLLVT